MKTKTKAELQALPDGIHALTREEYDQLEWVNFSTLKHMEKSPAHYRHSLTARDEDTDARQRGRAVALATFEPERFRSECVVWEGKARKGKEWEEFVARNPEKEHLTEGMHEAAIAISSAARNCAMAARYLSGGKGEQTLIWTHRVPPIEAVPGYEIRCKGRLDFIATCGAIVDLKNTKDASPDGFGKQCVNYLSHVQAAFYGDGFLAAIGKRMASVLIATEPTPPFITQVYEIDRDVLQLGREKYMGWLDRLNVCRETGSYPGYAESPMALQLPRWALPSDEELLEGGA